MRRILYKTPLFGRRFLQWWGRGGKDAVSAPSNTLREWISAYDSGFSAIKGVTGWSLDDYRLKCFDVPAQASFGNGVYGWQEVRLGGMWVRGLYRGDPRGTSGAFSAVGPQGQLQHGTMKHEAGGHHPLAMNKKDYTHNPLFDGVFPGWAESRRATGRVIDSIGIIYHFDTIEEEPLEIYSTVHYDVDDLIKTQTLETLKDENSSNL